MFTGLVAELGLLTKAPTPSPSGGVLLSLSHSEALSRRLEIGASLAVSGVCLTIVQSSSGESTVELSPETLRRTTLGNLAAGDPVNLEPALRLGDPLGGHWVQGHVDGKVSVITRRDYEQHSEIGFSLPSALERYLVEKGSVTVDGVSLTVSALVENPEHGFEVALIPHTLTHTTLNELSLNDEVNVEVDILAKYVERSIRPYSKLTDSDKA